MINYLYQTTIYTDTSNVVSIDVAQNDLSKTDYETNYKSSVIEITNIIIAETTFMIDRTYTQFKELINGTEFSWNDVKVISREDRYTLYINSYTLLG